jgi:hypothetical protein
MSTPKAAKRRLWIGAVLSLLLVSGGTVTGAGARGTARASTAVLAPSAASTAPEIVPGIAHADADVLDLQLD